MKGSKNIEIYLVRRTAKAGRKISGQTGVAMFTSATYVWTFIWRCLNEMWQQHQIYPWIDNNWRLIDVNCLKTMPLFLETCYFWIFCSKRSAAYFCIEIPKNHNKSHLKVNFRAHICGLRPRIKRHTCTFGRRLALRAIPPKLRSLNAAHLQENHTRK